VNHKKEGDLFWFPNHLKCSLDNL